MLSSGRDDESPCPGPESSDPLVAAVPSSDSPPGDGTDRVPGEGAATVSDPHHRSTFSIREYVFRSRSKDIYANWPFSRKNLQLCLGHGVAEVLPPFQHLDGVKCQPFEILKVKNRSFVGKNHITDFPCVPASSKSKVPSLDFAAEENVPSVVTRVSRASTEQLPMKTVIPPASFKYGSLAQSADKKCRLIVKFGARSERSSGDNGPNCTSVSENMASKVCPVCRTFLSSSNTTLNAHIDQCLSLDSMPKGLAIRHRIKPRKTRLMVDIYETAKRCTIEELNRRNGLTCASSLTMAAPTVDVASGEERGPCSQMVRAGISNDTSAVYIDAHGTKLRILSKFNDTQVELRSAKDVRLKKSLPGNKEIIMLKKKTKKRHGQKHKYHNIASKSKKLHSHDSQKNLHRMQENDEGTQGNSLWSQMPLKPGVYDTLKSWPSSKRTVLKKKRAAKEGENPQRCQLHPTRDLLDENDKTSLVSRIPTRSRSFSLLGSSENSLFSRSFYSEKEKLWSDCHSSEREEPGVCKRSLAWSDVTTDSIKKWGYPHGNRKLQKDNHFQEVNRLKIRKPAGHDKWSANSRELRLKSFSRKALRFSKLRKRVLSLCQSFENSSNVSVRQRNFFFKKPKWHSAGGMHHTIEDSSQDRSVEEDSGFEVSPGESCERKRKDLLEVAESSDITEKVHPAKPALDVTLDAEPSGDAVDDCTWGLSEYYDSTHLNDSDGSWTNSCSRQFLGMSHESLCGVEDDFSRAYNGCVDVNMEIANGTNDECYGAGQSSSFIDIDPIPIPGPPGSFLPSPGAMGSDDFQGNSSLTTSQAQSSHDHPDLIDGDVSDSPVSAMSTVSSSAEAKWGMDYSEDLISIARPLLPENPSSGFFGASNNSSSIQQHASAAPSSRAFPETLGGDTNGKKANNVFVKKGPPFMRNGDEPCCCQKMDRAVSRSSVLDYREMRPPSLRSQTDRISTSTRQSEVASEGSIAEAMKSLTMSSARGYGELSNGSDHAECDFPSPSGSNPVLRLMGKDLIIVNKEEDAAMLDRSQSSDLAPTMIRDSQSAAICGITRVSDRNRKEYRYGDTDYAPSRSFFLGSSNGSPGITIPTTVQAPKQAITKVGPLMNPGKAVMVIDGAYGKNPESTLSTFDNGNLPWDVVLNPRAPVNASREKSALPAIYRPREPLTPCEPVLEPELAGSHPKVMGFCNGMSGQDEDGLLLPRTSSFAAPQFRGHRGSGFVYYPSFS